MYRSNRPQIILLLFLLFFPPILFPLRCCSVAQILHTVLIASPYLDTLYIQLLDRIVCLFAGVFFNYFNRLRYRHKKENRPGLAGHEPDNITEPSTDELIFLSELYASR